MSSMDKAIFYATFIARIYILRFGLVIRNVNTIENHVWTTGWPAASQVNTSWTWLSWECCKSKIARVTLLHSQISQQERNWSFACVAVDRRILRGWCIQLSADMEAWRCISGCWEYTPRENTQKKQIDPFNHTRVSSWCRRETQDLAKAACFDEASPFFHVDASSTVNRWTRSESHPDEQTARPQASHANAQSSYIAHTPWLWINWCAFFERATQMKLDCSRLACVLPTRF